MYENRRTNPRHLNLLNGGGEGIKIFSWIPKTEFRPITEINKNPKAVPND